MITYNRNQILVKNVDILRSCFENVRKKFVFEVFAAVVLPDHIHLIIKPEEIENFSKIIGCVKREFTKALNEEFIDELISNSRTMRGEKGVWQRRFYDHIIRDEADLQVHLDYIHYNPVKHKYVSNVKDWAFSSFHKFVKLKNYDEEWGSSFDVRHIDTLQYD